MNNQKVKVTYLLGAGASVEALPLAKKTGDIPGLADELEILANGILLEKSSFLNDLKIMQNQLYELSKNSKKFITVDTYAKYLFHVDKKKFGELKSALSFYFAYQQFYNKRFDNRALAFVTSIIESNIGFPENIKIVSWNYDFQIQLAASYYQVEQFDMSGNITVHKPPFINYFPCQGRYLHAIDKQSNGDYSLIHLNGIAGIYYLEERGLLFNAFIDEEFKSVMDFFGKYYEISKSCETMLSFGWENNHMISNPSILDSILKSTINETEILVIIGYSFPFFNRELDQIFFDSVLSGGKLTKIIYQDPSKNGDFLKRQFGLHDSIQIENYPYKDSYYIPSEL